MSTSLRGQGWVFCAVAFTWVAASAVEVRFSAPSELALASLLIALLGVPHGALDVVFARRLFGTSNFKAWALFSILYVGVAASVVGVWWVLPNLFLTAFLVFSALHFGGDLASARMPSRILYGGAVIVLPGLWHSVELQQLLGFVAGPESVALVAPVLSQMAGAWLAVTALGCSLQARASKLAALEWAALATLAVAAPPLMAFTIYFCVMHSPRHVLKTLEDMPRGEARRAVALALWPSAAVLFVMTGMLWWSGGMPLQTWPAEANVIQVIFVGLAALTLPHMLLIARARRLGRRLHG
jgi:beta-carotene 15,15'-dioxygenase